MSSEVTFLEANHDWVSKESEKFICVVQLESYEYIILQQPCIP